MYPSQHWLKEKISVIKSHGVQAGFFYSRARSRFLHVFKSIIGKTSFLSVILRGYCTQKGLFIFGPRDANFLPFSVWVRNCTKIKIKKRLEKIYFESPKIPKNYFRILEKILILKNEWRYIQDPSFIFSWKLKAAHQINRLDV